MARFSRLRSPTYPPSSTSKPTLRDFLKNSQSKLFERTPLWFYILAEAEKAGGNRLGEVGSFLVASTFVGVLLADPEFGAVARFRSQQSPLRMARQQPDQLDRKMDALCERDGVELPVPRGSCIHFCQRASPSQRRGSSSRNVAAGRYRSSQSGSLDRAPALG